MSRVNIGTDRVYPVDYMFKKVEVLTDLLENEIVKTNDKVAANESQLDDIATR